MNAIGLLVHELILNLTNIFRIKTCSILVNNYRLGKLFKSCEKLEKNIQTKCEK